MFSRSRALLMRQPWQTLFRRDTLAGVRLLQLRVDLWQFTTSSTPTQFRTVTTDSNKQGLYDIYALPFSVSPEEALEKFETWADREQGLSYMKSSQVKLSAAYCPVWSFDLNLRFLVTNKTDGRKRLDWKPSLLQVYGTQSIVHLPGVAAYAGYNYRRSLVNAVHNTSLIFLRDQLVPFGPWMLRPMPAPSSDKDDSPPLQIDPDPWNATRRRALAVVREEWQALASHDYQQNQPDKSEDVVTVQSQVVRAKRVYMPTYVLEYSVLGATYQAFVSGADQGAAVSGVSHQLWETTPRTTQQQQQFAQSSFGAIRRVMVTLQNAANVLGPRNIGVLLVSILQIGVSVLGRLLLRIPILAAAAGVWIGIRKVLWPYFTNRAAAADWERERQFDATFAEKIRGDDFDDTTGTAERFFQRNRAAILRALAGEHEHGKGDFDWYDDWMEWARRVYEKEQQGFEQQQQQYQQSQQEQYFRQGQRSTSQQQTRSKDEYQWDFDPNDPYSVLKISPTASKKEISQAFRREMLKYHPDTQSNASEAERKRAVERSKLISAAYQKLKRAQ
eukprot:scaffold118_cov185-Amphora_coffeaeformis.AAC.10